MNRQKIMANRRRDIIIIVGCTILALIGEGPLAGQLAVFVRFKGCNLSCLYCDTKWANEPDVPARVMTAEEIHQAIMETGVRNVTLTGGEPLDRPYIS